ncbi:olfactory receptor 226 [Daphnia magna]|uniref:olfactory receptor 226 n=1 Tax=Daphnia magna TaxID=35525 RepID=UPI001E1BD196|nr:olfactory receptor 226 [Daphnia magna]XP_045032476.1 olfactory receptor 226 [Daphnia magna]XP_045032477.1 olfactory receptor 226 [Daphnia magna]XP_045032478.1 olfactory receptor 226 [Daphnia magna]XP_045032479.1 olfactory receptor 226 [Daphnia magna]XP_045032480.1 olfactory receptor 226 [Daphnia magna]XP_045032481.1 olfactory receptor 226 [Daphnia magna]XP_045032482.1 olfactory receptor 226 [Daphnia magna]XP_045032483.1 olfactory receptor 226 [Daphnia magna]XP_045032484.1 olfactory rece
MESCAGNCSKHPGIDFDLVTPVTLSRTETILYLICVSQGLPINLLIGFVIARNRRLHNPRNTFWFGIIVLNILNIFMTVLKMLVVYVAQPGDFTCLFFSSITGKPYTILLFVMLLATLDRYVAITHPLYHRKHVTVRLVIIVQLGISVAVFFLLSMPFIFGWIPLRCGFNLTLGKWTMFLRSILVSLCITAQVRVYLVTRKYLRQAEVQPLSIPMQQTGFVLKHRDDLQRPPSTTAAESSTSLSVVNMNKNAPFFVHRRNKTVSKLELEASLTLVVGVLSLCVITTPMFILYVALSVCQQVGGECTGMTYSIPYVRQAALIHAVYGPLIYMIRSREFASAVRKMLRPQSARFDDINYF